MKILSSRILFAGLINIRVECNVTDAACTVISDSATISTSALKNFCASIFRSLGWNIPVCWGGMVKFNCTLIQQVICSVVSHQTTAQNFLRLVANIVTMRFTSSLLLHQVSLVSLVIQWLMQVQNGRATQSALL